MNWHYEKNGIRHDGITEEEMTERVKRGELTASTLVWKPGMPDWQPLSTTPLTAALAHCITPPALPGHRIPHHWPPKSRSFQGVPRCHLRDRRP